MTERYRPQVVIVDGRHLLYRAVDAHRGLFSKIDGVEVPSGGVYGFLMVLLKMRRRYGGRYLVAWEGTGNYRFRLYPEYKKKGERTDEALALYERIDSEEFLLREILSALGVRQYAAIGGEADDVVGTLAHTLGRKREIAIFTADSDLQQLVRENVRCIVPKPANREVVMDAEAVEERWGVQPRWLPLLKAIAGDSSDNIPGIPGIGPKTAALFVNRYGPLERIVGAAGSTLTWHFRERFRLLVCEHADRVSLFLQLTTIQEDLRLDVLEYAPDRDVVRRLFRRYQFRRFLEAGLFNDLTRLG